MTKAYFEIELPNSCSRCDIYGDCPAVAYEDRDKDDRHPDCPLKIVPEPVDTTALRKQSTHRPILDKAEVDALLDMASMERKEPTISKTETVEKPTEGEPPTVKDSLTVQEPHVDFTREQLVINLKVAIEALRQRDALIKRLKEELKQAQSPQSELLAALENLTIERNRHRQTRASEESLLTENGRLKALLDKTSDYESDLNHLYSATGVSSMKEAAVLIGHLKAQNRWLCEKLADVSKEALPEKKEMGHPDYWQKEAQQATKAEKETEVPYAGA